jgi:hypothetical protein
MEIGKQAAALEAQGHRVIKLNIGEPDFGAPPAVIRAMRDLMDGRPMPYTAALGLPELRQAIAGFYRQMHGLDIPASRIVVTAGASAALLLVTAALVDPGDEVIVGDPSYPCNRQFLGSFGARVKLVPTTAAARYQLDAATVQANWSDATRGLMLATPSNPTGTGSVGGVLTPTAAWVDAGGLPQPRRGQGRSHSNCARSATGGVFCGRGLLTPTAAVTCAQRRLEVLSAAKAASHKDPSPGPVPKTVGASLLAIEACNEACDLPTPHRDQRSLPQEGAQFAVGAGVFRSELARDEIRASRARYCRFDGGGLNWRVSSK